LVSRGIGEKYYFAYANIFHVGLAKERGEVGGCALPFLFLKLRSILFGF